MSSTRMASSGACGMRLIMRRSSGFRSSSRVTSLEIHWLTYSFEPQSCSSRYTFIAISAPPLTCDDRGHVGPDFVLDAYAVLLGEIRVRYSRLRDRVRGQPIRGGIEPAAGIA